ncbi:MAG TPA: molecular chaperone DnaJ [Acidimicrobiales bacterium]|nr:molecular chaperone DnaJ [Acidimicrobiales bacterium]
MAPQREWFEKDYYKVLGVSSGATEKEITRAYRKLAKQFHPDANPGTEDRFKEISAAYDVLGDAAKRKEYDEVRRMGPTAAGFGGAGYGTHNAGGFSFNVDDLGDLFGGVFRQGNSRRRSGSPAQRGSDLEARLHLSFDESVEGLVTTVNVASNVTCPTCSGSGSKPGTTPVVCAVCGGTGVTNDNQGLFSLSTPCAECHGRGTTVIDPCLTCFGTGSIRKDRQVKVRIPSGVSDGQRIRIKGRGEPGKNGGPAGDLFVMVSVAAHPLFGRRGRDLTLVVPVTFAEATLGAQITVPSLDSSVTLKIPAGTKSGRIFRVRGRGMHQGGHQGDLLVTVEVDVPKHLTNEQREAIEALGKTMSGGLRSHLGV